MYVQHAEYRRVPSSILGNDKRGDFALFHQDKTIGRERFGSDGQRCGAHDRGCCLVESFRTGALEKPAEVSVGDDAEELAVALHGGHAEASGRHCMNDFGHGRGGSYAG